MTRNLSFIQQHLHDDVRQLAFRKVPEGIDLSWCLRQIEGWQLAQKKLPAWAREDAQLWFPPRLSMEQCSSEATALYKRRLVERLLPAERRKMMDLTGGFGIDFSYIAPLFREAVYVERQAELCDLARHNFPLLGLAQARVVNADCGEFLCSENAALGGSVGENTSPVDLLFLDPARRDDVGRKTVAIGDCTPNVVEMQTCLLAGARYVIVKLSPMLDITQALKELQNVVEVHVVSVKGECKELLLVMRGLGVEGEEALRYFCVNLETDDMMLTCSEAERRQSPTIASPSFESLSGQYLFEPNASVLKAGLQDMFCQLFGLQKLHPCSNLFVGTSPSLLVQTGEECVQTEEEKCVQTEGEECVQTGRKGKELRNSFPGRQFRIEAVCGFGKKELKKMLADLTKANLTIRNFPATVAELRRKWHLAEGGDTYLFATTLADGSHALLRCSR